MSKVFLIDTNKQPLTPVHPAQARRLLSAGKAAVFRHFPFTLILKTEVQHPDVVALRLKLDPGSKITGIALLNDVSGEVVWAAELTHRGHTIKKALDDRRGVRKSRRRRRTRYRKPRFANRRRTKGWQAPSLLSRVHNILTWVARLRHLAPITALSQELVRFDTQAITTPEIAGIEYQQGTLFGYEIREYLLEKWQRTCAYCGKQNVALQVEHIVAKANGGTDRVSNLCLACEPCNRKKETQDVAVFLKNKPEVLKRILAHAKAPLKDAAAVNATRWLLYQRLLQTGLPIEVGTGGRTKYNRISRQLAKTHWADAVCVGASTPEHVEVSRVHPVLIRATGHGSRQMCQMNKYGFPRTKPKQRHRSYLGFRTGDIVKAVIADDGIHQGRIAIRFSPSFILNGFDVHPDHLRRLHRNDGYSYAKGVSHSSFRLKVPCDN